MPIQTNKNEYSGITEHLVTGIVADEEMFACESEFYNNNPTTLQLWDVTVSDMSQITSSGMRRFIARSARLGEVRRGGRTAVVVASLLQYGLARMAETFGEFEKLPFEFRLFRNRADAIIWLKSAPVSFTHQPIKTRNRP